MTTTCGKCRKPLKSPKSIERGYGPICWRAILREQPKDPADESNFTYRIEGGENPVLIITDLDRGGKSVTNNMKAILEKIAATDGLDIYSFVGMPIIYCDSNGEYDGVKVNDRGIVMFYTLSEARYITDERKAIEAALRERGAA